LRGISVGSGGEFVGADFLQGNSAFPNGSDEGGCTSLGASWRGDEHPAQNERGAQEVLDGTNSFGDEEALSFTRVPAAQVARYAEHAHA
jgi:hypothetical protein